jgi:hypothetical protein
LRDRGSSPVLELTITLDQPGIPRVAFTITDGEHTLAFRETLLWIKWEGRVFVSLVDPRTDYERWIKGAEASDSRAFASDELNRAYGMGGPKELESAESGPDKRPRLDHFGTVAKAQILLDPGRYRIRALSDDGVRVRVDGKLVIDNWTWHGPTEDAGEFSVAASQMIQVEVEHFELDGYAVLSVDLESIE